MSADEPRIAINQWGEPEIEDVEPSEEEEHEQFLKLLRRRIRVAQQQIDEKQVERDRLMRLDADLAADQAAIRSGVADAQKMLKSLLPVKTVAEIRAEVRTAVYAALRAVRDGEDGELAVSRLIHDHLQHLAEDINWTGGTSAMETRVREALASLEESGQVYKRQVTTVNNRKAWLWRAATDEELDGL